MKYTFWALFIVLLSCNEHPTGSVIKKIDTSFVSNDTIPELRKSVSKKPVASYVTSVNDPKLERQFIVKIYETPYTFQYLLRMQYEEVLQTDTLKIPNFGSWPVVQINPGKDKRAVVVGFLDKKKNFKAYKMVSAYGDHMKLTILKKYDVAVYRK